MTQKEKEINEKNGDKFLKDLESVNEVLMYATTSKIFLQVRKFEVKQKAANDKIEYYMTDRIFVNGRITMIIL